MTCSVNGTATKVAQTSYGALWGTLQSRVYVIGQEKTRTDLPRAASSDFIQFDILLCPPQTAYSNIESIDKIRPCPKIIFSFFPAKSPCILGTARGVRGGLDFSAPQHHLETWQIGKFVVRRGFIFRAKFGNFVKNPHRFWKFCLKYAQFWQVLLQSAHNFKISKNTSTLK